MKIIYTSKKDYFKRKNKQNQQQQQTKKDKEKQKTTQGQRKKSCRGKYKNIRICKQNSFFPNFLKIKFCLTPMKDLIQNARRNWYQLNVLHLIPVLPTGSKRLQSWAWPIAEASMSPAEQRREGEICQMCPWLLKMGKPCCPTGQPFRFLW